MREVQNARVSFALLSCLILPLTTQTSVLTMDAYRNEYIFAWKQPIHITDNCELKLKTNAYVQPSRHTTQDSQLHQRR